MTAKANLVLVCGQCRWRPPNDAAVEAVALHMAVDHDTDKVAMDLVAWCDRCGVEAPLERRIALASGRTRYQHRCPVCLRSYTVEADA